MKQGTTTTFNFHFNIDLNQVDSIDFFFHCDRDNKQKREPLLTKSYPTDGYEQDGIIYMPLKQEETAVLPNKFYIEPQISFIDKSSTKAHTKAYNMEPTIYTHFIDENQSNGEEENIDIEFEVDESIVIKGYDYDESYHKPRINDNELAGNKTGAELGLQDKLIAGVNITIAADGKTISAANGGKFIIVEELPEEDIDLTAIYLLPREDEKENNIYDEYIYIENISEWEKIGSTEVNLENYYTKDETDELLDDKQDILSATGHININNNVITTEANKVYPAVMDGDNISTDLSDYPNIEMGDIAIGINNNKIKVWVQGGSPVDIVYWQEIKYSSQKITQSENAPVSSGYSTQYSIGDLWLQEITGQTTTYKVFILVNMASGIPPLTLTWVDLTSETEYTAGNGIDINNNTINVSIDSTSSNILGFTDGKLWLNTASLPTDISFQASMPYNTTIRQRLADTSVQNALQPKLTAGANITIDSNNVISASGGGLYTFTDGLTESSGTVGIDLASGSKLLIDANDKLDVDLSSYVKNTDYATSTVGGTIVGNATSKFNINSSGKPSATTTTYSDYQSGVDGMFIGKGTLENVITGKQLVNQTDLSSKQDTIDTTHKLDADLVDDTSSTNKFVSATDKQTWNAKADTSDIPTNVSELNNDSGYQTSSDVALAIIDKEDKTTISTDTSSTTVSLTLADNHEYRYTQDLTSLTLTMPSGDFISSIVFASGSTPTSMTYDSSIKWSGDDITNGQFVPTADKDYDIMMYYNGLNVNGIVRGV